MTQYNHAAIRQFLIEVFSAEELTNFCFDHFLDFHQANEDLPHSDKARELVEYCLRKGQFDDLMAALERQLPEPFQQQRDQMIVAMVVSPVPAGAPADTSPEVEHPSESAPRPAALPAALARLISAIRPVYLYVAGGILLLALVVWGVTRMMAASSDATETPAVIAAGNTLANVPTVMTTLPASAQPSQTPSSTATATLPPSQTPSPVSTAAPVTTQEPVITPSLPFATWVRPADEMVMVEVPPGTFTMGSNVGDPNARGDEFPAHEVTLAEGFWLDQTEVTNEQYRRCVAARACIPSIFADNPNFDVSNQPVVGIFWADANNYCAWVGGRLPTEAEWEYAARGGDGRIYPWGHASPNSSLLNYNENYDQSLGRPAAVGSYPSGASWVGALDMLGNVWEWVNDWYGLYSGSPVTNPTGPESGTHKVFRGGGWFDTVTSVRAAARAGDTLEYRGSVVGFRCVGGPGD